LALLFDKYQDQEFVANAQKEVEQIRQKASYLGGAVTAAAFTLNEVSRMTLRTRKQTLSLNNHYFTAIFKLKA
jgi:hypothetical protein